MNVHRLDFEANPDVDVERYSLFLVNESGRIEITRTCVRVMGFFDLAGPAWSEFYTVLMRAQALSRWYAAADREAAVPNDVQLDYLMEKIREVSPVTSIEGKRTATA